MEKTFVIAWRSRAEPRWGRGKKLFTREEAEALADEMNGDYPAFVHTAVDVAATQTPPAPEPEIIQVDFRTTPAIDIPVGDEAARELVTA